MNLNKKNPAKGEAVKEIDYGYCDLKVLNGYSIHENMSKALEEVIAEKKDSKQALAGRV